MAVHKTSIMFLAVICITCSILSVHALNSDQWTCQFYWNNSTNIYYQGDNATITFTFISNTAEQLKINLLEIALDWAPNTYYSNNLSSNPVDIASYGQRQFNPISIGIPSDVSVGVHELTFTFSGQEQVQGSWSSFSVSGTGTVTVLDATEGVYNQKAQSLSASLRIASDSIINNPEAVGLLGQAYDAYNEASHLANLGQWQAAINELNTASNYPSQAQAAYAAAATPTATPTSTKGSSSPQSSLLFITIVILLLVIAILLAVTIALLLHMRHRKTTNLKQ